MDNHQTQCDGSANALLDSFVVCVALKAAAAAAGGEGQEGKLVERNALLSVESGTDSDSAAGSGRSQSLGTAAAANVAVNWRGIAAAR